MENMVARQQQPAPTESVFPKADASAKAPREFDELTFMRSIVGKVRKLDYRTASRVLDYAVRWNETRTDGEVKHGFIKPA